LDIISFEEAILKSKGHNRNLLIGNGFSTRFFNYKDLLEKSGFAVGSPIRMLFEKLATVDFEFAMRALEGAAVVEEAYGNDNHAKELLSHAAELRDGLVRAINEVHPKYLASAAFDYKSSIDFLLNFQNIFTLNYDLLLYWVGVQAGNIKDGFGLGADLGGFQGPFKEEAHCNTYNLHGGLQLFENKDGEIIKAKNTGEGVIAQISNTISGRKKLPIYVAEGTSLAKMKKINSIDYLRHCFKQLASATGVTFIYGHSADDNDAHIYYALFSSGIEHIYFGVYQPTEEKIAKFDSQLAKFSRLMKSKVSYSFFDAESAKVWG